MGYIMNEVLEILVFIAALGAPLVVYLLLKWWWYSRE